MSPDQVLRHAVRLLSTDDGRRMLLEQLSPEDREALAMQVLSKELLLRLAGQVPWTDKELRSLGALAQAARTNVVQNILNIPVDYERYDGTGYTYVPGYVDVRSVTIVQLRRLYEVLHLLPERDAHVVRREARRRGL